MPLKLVGSGWYYIYFISSILEDRRNQDEKGKKIIKKK